jgi:hypothetical protein
MKNLPNRSHPPQNKSFSQSYSDDSFTRDILKTREALQDKLKNN